MKSFEITYKNGIKNTITPLNLRTIQVDGFTFMFHEHINLCQVYLGYEYLELLREFTISEFDLVFCINYLKNYVNTGIRM
ncbi:hypothetical protein [Peptostreptococcus faecalis]|uniref:hypothetical protein n=1 Tax=Peptostreptococcus faecalis TaxID=2045015 RepID=UPI000C7AED67|nr:hypothetical protein [Peptostreptococcus faecalis]